MQLLIELLTTSNNTFKWFFDQKNYSIMLNTHTHTIDIRNLYREISRTFNGHSNWYSTTLCLSTTQTSLQLENFQIICIYLLIEWLRTEIRFSQARVDRSRNWFLKQKKIQKNIAKTEDFNCWPHEDSWSWFNRWLIYLGVDVNIACNWIVFNENKNNCF